MDRTDPRHVAHELTPLERVLQTMSYHTGLVMTEPAPSTLKMGLSHEDVLVLVEITIQPSSCGPQEDSPLGPNVMDQCCIKVEGEAKGSWVGNRCGARQALAALYAPVIAAAAAMESETERNAA